MSLMTSTHTSGLQDNRTHSLPQNISEHDEISFDRMLNIVLGDFQLERYGFGIDFRPYLKKAIKTSAELQNLLHSYSSNMTYERQDVASRHANRTKHSSLPIESAENADQHR